jgi:hypothetical protein
MPLLRIQRYLSAIGIPLVDYFLTEGSYDAGNQSLALQLDPSLFPTVGNYAIIRTTGAISNLASPIGPTATWTSADSRTLSAPLLDVSQIDGVVYNIIYVTVSA